MTGSDNNDTPQTGQQPGANRGGSALGSSYQQSAGATRNGASRFARTGSHFKTSTPAGGPQDNQGAAGQQPAPAVQPVRSGRQVPPTGNAPHASYDAAPSSHGYGAAGAVAGAAANEGLRRVKKKKHKTLKYVGIGCGSLLALVLVFVAIFAVWFGMLGSSMSIKDDKEREELQEELTPVSSAGDPFYVLILGSDAREADAGSRSDVLMLTRIDPTNATISLVSIPRDTMVTINGSTQKINAAYAYGGSAMAVRTVSEFAGVPISHFVSLHFEELEEIVDMLGGVWVDIPESFSAGNGGMGFSAGKQLLTGKQALAYARERYNVSGGDFGRAQAQRQIVEAVIRQVLDSSPVELPGLIGQLANCVTTDLSVTDIVGYAQDFLGKDVTIYSSICPSYTLNQGGVSYVATMFDEWKRMMQLTDAGLDPNDETAEVPQAQADNTKLGAASNSASPRDYKDRAQNAMTTDDVAELDSSSSSSSSSSSASDSTDGE